jgi:hypothetical protein
LSDGEDDAESTSLSGQSDPTGRVEPSTRHVPIVDDAEDARKTSTEANNHGPIGAGVPGTTKPPVADQVPTTPPLGACGRKCPRIAMKRSDQGRCVAQVIAQIELASYRGPWGQLDLIASEIVFDRIFEAFHRMSQAKICVVAAAPAGDDNPLRNRTRRASLVKKIMTPK